MGASETVDPTRGIFLDRSYRMAPPICEFVSHAVYEDRLHAGEATAGNAVREGALTENGLHFIPVAHERNKRHSDEEARTIVERVGELLRARVAVSAL